MRESKDEVRYSHESCATDIAVVRVVCYEYSRRTDISVKCYDDDDKQSPQ